MVFHEDISSILRAVSSYQHDNDFNIQVQVYLIHDWFYIVKQLLANRFDGLKVTDLVMRGHSWQTIYFLHLIILTHKYINVWMLTFHIYICVYFTTLIYCPCTKIIFSNSNVSNDSGLFPNKVNVCIHTLLCTMQMCPTDRCFTLC